MKINFTFDHLTYFYEAAKLGSITKASKARCVSQSTVSHGIKKLEEALGVPLIKHRNSFELTEHGSIVFAEAKDVFDAVSHLYSKVQTYSQKPLKLICPNSLSNYLVPLLFAKTKASKLHESLTTISASSKQVITNYLNQGLADLALVLEDPEKRQFSQFQSESLFKGKFNAYINQVAAQQEEPTLLIHKNDHPSIDRIVDLFRELHKGKRVVIQKAESCTMIAKLIKSNYASGALPDFIASEYGFKPLLPVLDSHLPNYDLLAVWKDRQPAISKFILDELRSLF